MDGGAGRMSAQKEVGVTGSSAEERGPVAWIIEQLDREELSPAEAEAELEALAAAVPAADRGDGVAAARAVLEAGGSDAEALAAVRGEGEATWALSDLRNVEAQSPDPVISHASTRAPVAVRGAVTVLAGVGGIGKSTIALTLALAAADALAADRDEGEACGLVIAAEPVVLASHEDEAGVVAERARVIAEAIGAGRWRDAETLHVTDSLPAIFGPSDQGARGRPGPLASWDPFWERVRNVGAALLVLDPLTASYSGDAHADAAGARAYVDALRREARASGCAVLLVAHAAKSERLASGKRQAQGQLDADNGNL